MELQLGYSCSCQKRTAHLLVSANTWNKLPVSTQHAENIAVFKKLLKITATGHKHEAIKPKLLLKQNYHIQIKLDQCCPAVTPSVNTLIHYEQGK